MATFHRSTHFRHKTTRTTMTTRVRCANCRGYFDRQSFFYKNGITRICTEQCFHEWVDRKRSKSKKKVAVTPKTPIATRFEIKERDGYRCRWCGGPGTQVHHIIYRSQGGPDVAHNLLLLCAECHERAHSSKEAFQPLLLAHIWLRYVEGRNLQIPEVARYLERRGLLTPLQQRRLNVPVKQAS